jgi:DNA-binding MarR family transcriptional regulator
MLASKQLLRGDVAHAQAQLDSGSGFDRPPQGRRDQAAAPAEDPSVRLRAVIGQLSRRLRPTVAGSGLTPSQIAVLFAVVRLGRIGLSELAEAESLNPTMLSRVSAQLCEAGLIRRSADPQDRRSAFLAPTAAGRRLRERIQRERARALSEHLAELDESQRRTLWRALPVLEELAERIPGGRR